MTFSRASMKQKAYVYQLAGWAEDGEPVLGAKQTITCRWVDAEHEGTLVNGDQLTARVATLTAVAVGSVLQLVGGDGRLQQAAQATSALDIKGRRRRYELQLTRYKGSFPEGGTGSA